MVIFHSYVKLPEGKGFALKIIENHLVLVRKSSCHVRHVEKWAMFRSKVIFITRGFQRATIFVVSSGNMTRPIRSRLSS